MLTTKNKIRIAKMLHMTIVGARSKFGLRSVVDVRRRGVNWHLDLNEGIELAIYLGLYQTIPARVLEHFVKPGAFVIDVGANIGAHGIPIAKRVGASGRVLMIEPTNYAFSRLEANAALNTHLRDNLILVQAALTDGDTAHNEGSFFSRWPLQDGSGDRHAEHLGVLEAASRARFLTLDSLLDELRIADRVSGPVVFIKLDVDGHELQVLRGAQEVLARDRPAILIEIAPYVQDEVPNRLEAIINLLSSMRYRLEDSASGQAFPMSAQGLRSMIAYGAGLDVMACPA